MGYLLKNEGIYPGIVKITTDIRYKRNGHNKDEDVLLLQIGLLKQVLRSGPCDTIEVKQVMEVPQRISWSV